MSSETANIELDPATAALLEVLAKSWGVSKEEAVHRAVAEAKVTASVPRERTQSLEAFRELQRRLQMTPERAVAWQNAIREGRR